MAEDPGSGDELDTGVKLHRVAALYWHLQSGIAGNSHTASHPLSYLGLPPLQEGFPGGPLSGGPGSLLEAGLQPGVEEVAGEAGHASGVLRVLGNPGGGGPGLGRTDVASLGAGGITYVTTCSVSETNPLPLRLTKGWRT